jgi:hypothetical protein
LNARNFQDSWFGRKDTQIFCHNKPNKDDCRTLKGSILVEHHAENTMVLIFCDGWFNLGTLSAIYEGASRSDAKWDLSRYDNRARHWITAIMQIKTIGTWPDIGDGITVQGGEFPTRRFDRANKRITKKMYVQGAAEAKYMAKLTRGNAAGGWGVITANPDNWSWYALASYVQEKLGDYPHKPVVPNGLLAMA